MILLPVKSFENKVLGVHVVAPDLLRFSNCLKLMFAGTES